MDDKHKKGGIINKIKVAAWAFKTAWNIKKSPIIIWYGLSALIAVLPAISLHFNRESLAVISGFLAGEAYVFADVVPQIIFLGLFLTLVGLSARINGDLVYMMMYDTYYCGTQELVMDTIQRVEMKDILRKDINDVYNFCIIRAGSLIDLISGTCAIVSKLVSIVSLLVVAFTSSKLVFVISAVYIIGMFLLNFMFTEKTRSYEENKLENNRLADYFASLSDDRGIAKETRMYGNVETIVDTWKVPFTKVQDADKKRFLSTELRDFIGGAGFYVFLILIVGISLVGVAKGNTTPDIFLVLFTLCMNIYTAISGMARNIYTFDQGLYALEKQKRFFDNAPISPVEQQADGYDAALDEDIVFDVENVCFSYTDGKPVIKNLDLKIGKGEVIALVGQNGSGKSTLVKLLLDIYKPDSGTVKVFGREYKDYKRDYIRNRISVFFQDFYIFHQSLRMNVAAGNIKEINDTDKIRAAMKKGGSEKLIDKLADGLNTLLGKFIDKNGIELSGGEKQRVGVSRTHMSDRDVLIFDEPASMLDPIAEQEQFAQIKNMLGGRTAILISHRIGFARMADKVIMMSNGEIAEQGTHDELMALDGLYAGFFREQAQWYNGSVDAKEVQG